MRRGTLLIAKLDRLSRSVAFLATLQESGAKFIAADMPEADETTIHLYAAIAQRERKAISERTKAALAAAKARGTRLGNPNGAAALRRAGKGNGASVSAIKGAADDFARDLLPVIERLRSEGSTSLNAIADGLNSGGFQTPRGGQWYATSVRNLLARVEAQVC